MEEFRDERLSRIMSWMQAWARGYLTRKTFKKLQEQRMALTVVQRSLRRYLKLRTWPWWKLWQKVKPLLNASRVEDQIAVSIHPARFSIRISGSISLRLINSERHLPPQILVPPLVQLHLRVRYFYSVVEFRVINSSAPLENKKENGGNS
jgi:IQ calmodulin-binding motif